MVLPSVFGMCRRPALGQVASPLTSELQSAQAADAADTFVKVNSASVTPHWQVKTVPRGSNTYEITVHATEEGTHKKLNNGWKSPEFDVAGISMFIDRPPFRSRPGVSVSDNLQFALNISRIGPGIPPQHIRTAQGSLIWENSFAVARGREGIIDYGSTVDVKRAAGESAVYSSECSSHWEGNHPKFLLYERSITNVDLCDPASPLSANGNLNLNLTFNLKIPFPNLESASVQSIPAPVSLPIN